MTDGVNTRELVLEILLEVTGEQEFSHIAIRNVLDKYSYLSRQERAFIKRLSEGTIERMIELDYLIDQISKTKVSKMKPVIRNILRMGTYQLKYMDRVPRRAACNEAVKLAVRKGFSGLKGFVNGVMRNLSRRIDEISLPDEKTQREKWLSVKFSMPEWLVSDWVKTYGYDRSKEMFQAFLEPSVTSIRTNLLRITPEELRDRLESEGVTVRENPKVSYGFFLSDYDSLGTLKTFAEGLFYVQDTASMLAVEQADVKPGAYVIDVCAAPGGKSVHMAEKLGGTGMVEARDLTDYKVQMMEENIERMQLSNMRAVCRDARVSDPASVEQADVVLADLPCSGLGVIGRKPDIKYRMTPEKIRELAALQREILGVVQQYVKPGGLLLYSTCTVSDLENRENARWFEERFPHFQLEAMEQTFPERWCTDGFFTARFRKQM